MIQRQNYQSKNNIKKIILTIVKETIYGIRNRKIKTKTT